MIAGITIEICAGSLTDVIHASSVEAVDRIELNSSLELGGITPSLNTLVLAKKYSDQKIICMVRPRPAGFVYNNYEKETMYADAETFLKHGADGIVFGSLDKDHTVDQIFTEKMVRLIHSYGKEAVFHKAFDLTPDAFEAADTLASLHVDRILTSGQKESSEDGTKLIHDLNDAYGSRIAFLPGGGVSETNVAKILRETGCHQIHMTAKSSYEDNGSYYAVDKDRIQKIIQVIALARKQPERMQDMPEADLEMLENDRYEDQMLSGHEDDHDRY